LKNAHVNIPVFIPHLGCPNMCVFCNQRAISGVSHFYQETAKEQIETVLSTIADNVECEIAFFGGSFTGIDRNLMIDLLDLAQSYVDLGKVSGIRMSTRPDYINSEIIDILKKYTVSAVELGVQSFSDSVLTKCKRGHCAHITREAFSLLNEAGIDSVGQMMIGLPGATLEDEISCATEICSCGAKGARIYPTIVFKETELCEMTQRGEYVPLTLDEAVNRSATVLEVFIKNDVDCLRIGLCESDNLHSDKSYFAGPNHPSLGELVYSEVFYRIISRELDERLEENRGNLTLHVPKGRISTVVGQNRRNIIRLKDKYQINNVKFIENPTDMRYNIMLEFN